jgi:hypothetical protein
MVRMSRIVAIVFGWWLAMSTPIPIPELLRLPPLTLLLWLLVGTFGVCVVGLACYSLGRDSSDA